MELFLRYEMSRAEGAAPFDELYAECLAQCAYADKAGIEAVRLHEHHGRDDGYLPSPVVLGAAIAARTERMKIRFSILVLGLHHPLRIAEDLAVLDQIAQGRVEVTVSAGYRVQEFLAFDEDVKDRVRLMEDKIAVLRQAWLGKPFLYNGIEVLVTPRPHNDREMPIYMGGSSPLSARIAARLADGYDPAFGSLKDFYWAECEKLGKEPGWTTGNEHYAQLLHISEDPDRSWSRIAPYALHETNAYARDGIGAVSDMYQEMADATALRGPGQYHVVTPDEAYELMLKLGPTGAVTFAPLLCGMPADLGWESLELLVDKVIPRLEAAGVR